MPLGVLDQQLPQGQNLPPEWALQVPSDYVDVLRTAVPEAVAAAGINPAAVVGIGTDFTACTMLPVRSDGTPLCELDASVRSRTLSSSSGVITPRSRRRTGSTRWPANASRPGCPATAG